MVAWSTRLPHRHVLSCATGESGDAVRFTDFLTVPVTLDQIRCDHPKLVPEWGKHGLTPSTDAGSEYRDDVLGFTPLFLVVFLTLDPVVIEVTAKLREDLVCLRPQYLSRTRNKMRTEDNKRFCTVLRARWRARLRLRVGVGVCVCACVCVRACARVCVMWRVCENPHPSRTYFHIFNEYFVGAIVELEKVKAVVHLALFRYHVTPLFNFFRDIVVQHKLRLRWGIETGCKWGIRERGGGVAREDEWECGGRNNR